MKPPPPWQKALDTMFKRRQNRLYMPTMVLSVVHLVDIGAASGWEVLFADVEQVFERLGGAALAGKAWQPFFHLSSSAGTWDLYKGSARASFADLRATRPKSRGSLTRRADRACVREPFRPGLLDPVARRAITWTILQRLLLEDAPLPRQLTRLDGVPIGRPYVPQPPPQFAAASYTRAYSAAPTQRASTRHHALQEQLARFLHQHQLKPLAPMSCDPAFDLAWQADGQLHVAEVKSLTTDNESEQLRRGLGQVLEYRHLLERRVAVRPRALLLVERRPERPHWPGVCKDADVDLVWPEQLKRVVYAGQSP